MLKQRIITALIIAPILITIILWFPVIYLKLFFACIILLAAWEWSKLAGIEKKVRQLIFVIAVGLVIALLDYYRSQYDLIRLFAVLAAVWWFFVVAIVLTYPNNMGFYRRFSLVLGLITLVLAWLSATDLHSSSQSGPFYLLYVCCLVSAADIGAYFIGRRFGKTLLAPKLSPGKTVAGLFGGVLSASALAVLAVVLFDFIASPMIFMLLSLLVAIFSVVGDLFESLLKREAGVKDSGTILPGHGGVLDRIDSTMAAVPIFWVGSIWLL